MNYIETMAQEFMRNQTAVMNEAVRFMRKQKWRNFRTGVLLVVGGYLIRQMDGRIYRQASEIRELRNELEEIKERE